MSGTEVRAAIVSAARECEDADARARAARREVRRLARAARGRERGREAFELALAAFLGWVMLVLVFI